MYRCMDTPLCFIGVGRFRILWGGWGGEGGGQTFRWLLTDPRAPHLSRLQSVPNNYISHINTDYITKLRIELKSILLAIPSNLK